MYYNPFIAFFSKKIYKGCMATSRKVYSVRINEQRMKQLKHLAVDTDKSLGTLLEEAIHDLLKKYEKKPQK
jgi:hypothetical protein